MFPDYFGFNWDSLEECLRDLEWIPAKGHVLRVRGATEFWQRSAAVAGALVESWLIAAEQWAQDEVSFGGFRSLWCPRSAAQLSPLWPADVKGGLPMSREQRRQAECYANRRRR